MYSLTKDQYGVKRVGDYGFLEILLWKRKDSWVHMIGINWRDWNIIHRRHKAELFNWPHFIMDFRNIIVEKKRQLDAYDWY